jgi:hypothetical protein
MRARPRGPTRYRPLVAGSGLEFEERGSFPLKGLDNPWTLYEVKA